MTRTDMLAHAVGMLTELSDEAGVALADDSMGIRTQLDAAVRDLGTDTANTAAGEALVEYHVLRRMRYAIAVRVDSNQTAVQRNKSQVFAQLESLINDAANRAAAAGHAVVPTIGGSAAAGLSLVRLNLDWAEPAIEEWAE